MKGGSLHVWRASLIPGQDLGRFAEEVLSEEERGQCERFVRAEDRARCAAARAALRIVLSKYVSRAPRSLSILTGESGKPYLDASAASGATGVDDIQFNVAHSGNLLQIAVSRGLRVGVDVERIRNVRGMESIVEDFFDEAERGFVRGRKGKAKSRAFFRLWTRREAAAKAMGLDLFDAFARCELPAFDESRSGFRIVMPRSGARNGVPPGMPRGAPPGVPPGPADVWWIRDFIPAPGCADALCVEQENADPLFYQLRSW